LLRYVTEHVLPISYDERRLLVLDKSASFFLSNASSGSAERTMLLSRFIITNAHNAVALCTSSSSVEILKGWWRFRILKNAVVWSVMSCGSCKNRRAGGTYRLYDSVLRSLVTAIVVPNSPILVARMIEAIRSSETSILKEQHGATSKTTAVFIVTALKNIRSYKVSSCG
jgi:hypothetical protein